MDITDSFEQHTETSVENDYSTRGLEVITRMTTLVSESDLYVPNTTRHVLVHAIGCVNTGTARAFTECEIQLESIAVTA